MTQSEALAILKTGANIFLSGEPGAGKTHTINEYTDWLRACGIEPAITAATGIAATHVGGQTLHSWSGIGISDNLSPAEIDRIATKEHIARRIGKAKVLIIEEISMLSAATFEAASAVCKEVRRVDKPFGGLTVVMVGDFFQLPPVSKGREIKFAYDSETWRDLNPITCYLTEQYRQDDQEFLGVLSAIRRDEVEEMHYESLTARKVLESAIPEGIPLLYSHNADVDRINTAELAKLPGKVKRYLMSTSGSPVIVEGLKRGCLSPENLELKEGAVVMFTKNSPQGRFVNGTVGKVEGFDAAGYPIIETKDGEKIIAEPMDWQVEENGRVRASLSQVPLRLAWAMTVHKSQGMSMDAAAIDLSQAFEYGQGYVALSRVRRLSGLYLLGINARALQVHPQILEKDRELRAASGAADELFRSMSSTELEELQKRFIKALGGAWTNEIVEGKPKTAMKKKTGLKTRLAETLGIVREARTLEAAAKARDLAASTIVSHLEELKEAGTLKKQDFAHLLPGDNAAAEIIEAFDVAGTEKLTPVFKLLRGAYSFETIRLVRLTID